MAWTKVKSSCGFCVVERMQDLELGQRIAFKVAVICPVGDCVCTAAAGVAGIVWSASELQGIPQRGNGGRGKHHQASLCSTWRQRWSDKLGSTHECTLALRCREVRGKVVFNTQFSDR